MTYPSGPENGAVDPSLWEPLGVREAERKRAGTVGPASPTENGLVGHPSPSTATDPAPLSADDDQRLREAVIRLRWQQPEEWDVFSRLAAIDKRMADMQAVIDMQTEVILRLSSKAANRLNVQSMW